METAELEQNERGSGAGALHRDGPPVGSLWGQARDQVLAFSKSCGVNKICKGKVSCCLLAKF